MNFVPGTRTQTNPPRQQGVALVMTLIILTIVTVLGIAAMRGGLLHVAIGTNAQVNMLTFQQADAGLAAMETILAQQAAVTSTRPTEPGGLLDMAPGYERVFCVKKAGPDLPTTPTGRVYCDPTATNDTDYLSARNATLVQVAVITPLDGAAASSEGNDDRVLGAEGILVRTISTSVLPNYGNANPSTIKACLLLPSDDTSNPAITTVTDCLATAGASFTTLVQEYNYKAN